MTSLQISDQRISQLRIFVLLVFFLFLQPCQSGCPHCAGLCTINTCTGSCKSGFIRSFDWPNFICSCVPPCDSCHSDIATYCYTCDSAQQFALNGKCVCPDGKYWTGSICSLCTGKCAKCETTSTNCLTCLSVLEHAESGQCVCNDGYFIQGAICISCTSPCTTCETTDIFCKTCNYQNYHVTLGTCICNDGYYLNGNNCSACTLPCTKCITNSTHCLSCIDINQTTNALNQCICNSGYIPNGIICDQCIPPCQTCSTTVNTCDTCIDINMDYNAINHTCTCKPGFIIRNGSICDPCVAPCATCSGTTTTCDTCTDIHHIHTISTCICADAYYSDTPSTCLACTLPCYNCNANGCISCIDTVQYIVLNQCICHSGHYMVGVNCVQCTPPCYDCQIDHNICESCVDSKQILQDNTCICQPGYFMLGFMCEQCTLPCVECIDDQYTCTNCLDPLHILIGKQCICQDGWANIGIECHLCQYPCGNCQNSITNCITCSDPNVYTLHQSQCICKPGYYLTDDYCRTCSIECSTCELFAWNCLSCASPNFLLIQNTCICDVGYIQQGADCVKCTPPCEQCQVEQTICTSCIDLLQHLNSNNNCVCLNGYYMNNEYMCSQCNFTCPTCLQLDYCLNCIDQYYLSNHMCVHCQLPCDRCLDANNCLTCVEAYLLAGSTCFQCPNNCKTCVTQYTCQICYVGYYLVDGQCYPCIYPCNDCIGQSDNCLQCIDPYHALINNRCHCIRGYYEEQQQCNQCTFPCDKCTSSNNCEQCLPIQNLVIMNNQCVCLDNYYYQAIIYTCLSCSDTCKTCETTAGNCLSCIDNQNRELRSNQCDCKNGYVAIQESTICIECTSKLGMTLQVCQYSDCLDMIWTWSEQCDDGNSIPNDGCTNCTIDAGYHCTNTILKPSQCYNCPRNCLECTITESLSQCNVCLPGYYLNLNECKQCQNNCLECIDTAFTCTVCRFYSVNNVCRLCESKIGEFSDFESNKCYSICGDGQLAVMEQCDDGNQLNGDGCTSDCMIEAGYYCTANDGCNLIIYPTPILTAQYGDLYDEFRIYKLEYQETLVISNPIPDSIYQLNISSLIDFKYEIDQTITIIDQGMHYQATITVQLQVSSTNNNITLNFMELSEFINNENGQQQVITTLTTNVYDYIQLSNMEKMAISSAISSNTYILYIILIIFTIAVIFGGIEIFYNLLDLLQVISYLKYINTRFPYNLNTFFESFEFAQFKFLDDYFDIGSLSIFDTNVTPPPKKISDDGYSSLIVVNGFSFILVWVIFILTYLGARLMLSLSQRINISFDIHSEQKFKLKIKGIILILKHKVVDSCLLIKDSFISSGLYRIHLSTAYDYSLALMLNIYAISTINNDIIIRVNYYLTLSLLIVYIIIIINALESISIKQFQFHQTVTIHKIGSLYEGLNLFKYSKYYNIILLQKKFIFMAILVICYHLPIYQITNIIFLQVIQIVFLLSNNPIKIKYEKVKQVLCEVIILITELFIFVLVIDDNLSFMDTFYRNTIGWICIGCISVIIVIQLILDIVLQFQLMYKTYRSFRNMINQFTLRQQLALQPTPNLQHQLVQHSKF